MNSKFRQTWVGQNLKLGLNVKFKGFNSVGNGVEIGDQCEIVDSVLMDQCQVGTGVKMVRSIIGRDCRIGDFSICKKGTVLGDKTNLPANFGTK